MAQIEKSMFREYDIRGKENDRELNPASMELIGKGYASFLKRRGINRLVVGHDNRATSEDFVLAVSKGLVSSGCHVIDIGRVLTPMLYWAQYHFQVEGGVMVTASHNPAGWNGVKLALGYSTTLNQQDLEEILHIIETDNFQKGNGKIKKEENIFENYKKDLLSRVTLQKKMKVVVNTGNGTAGFFAPDFLRAAGCEVIEHLTEPDPEYPNYTPNPAQVEMMTDTGKKVRDTRAHFGIAIDGDGDRLGLTNEKGETVWPDRYLILLSRLILEKNPGAKIVFDVKVSQALPEDIESHGGIPIMWKTGHSHIKAKLKEEKAALAGEMSGHIFFADNFYGFDDALFTALKLVEYFSHCDKSVSNLVAETPYYISTPALHAECPDEKKYQVVQELTEEFKKSHNVVDINGARVYFGKKSWGLIRASSNLPALVLRFEAKTNDEIKEIESVFREKLKAYSFVSQEWYPA